MKNTVKLFGNLTRARSAKVPIVIIAFAAIIGFSFVSCEEVETDELDGTTWKWEFAATENSMAGSYILAFNTPNYTIKSGNSNTVEVKGKYSISGNDVTLSSDSGIQSSYTLSGDKKTLTSSGGTAVYKKQ